MFSDNLAALELYCHALSTKSMPVPYLCGETKGAERQKVLSAFKTSRSCNALGLSKVGDTALDIPEANVIIQASRPLQT